MGLSFSDLLGGMGDKQGEQDKDAPSPAVPSPAPAPASALSGLNLGAAGIEPIYRHTPGAPILWSPQLEDAILQLVSEGHTLKVIERKSGVPIQCIWRYRRANNVFSEKFLHAQEIGFEIDADKLKTAHEDIDDAMKARLFSENTRWLLARRASSKYGDRLDITHNQTVDIGKALNDARKRSQGISSINSNAIDVEVVGDTAMGLIESELNNSVAQNTDRTSVGSVAASIEANANRAASTNANRAASIEAVGIDGDNNSAHKLNVEAEKSVNPEVMEALARLL